MNIKIDKKLEVLYSNIKPGEPFRLHPQSKEILVKTTWRDTGCFCCISLRTGELSVLRDDDPVYRVNAVLRIEE